MADVNGIPEATETPNTPSDNPIDRMIDIAIEAQDGPAPKENTETPSGEEGTATTNAAPAVTPDSNGDGSNNQQQQPAKPEAAKEQTANRAQDLTLPDGSVVKGGAERRLYEQRELARQQASTYQQEVTRERSAREKAEGELRTLRDTVQSLNGVEPNTLRIGVQIVRDLQSDPVGTMKKLLAEVIAQGHTIEGIGSGVDQLAMQRMIDARLEQQVDTTPTDEQIAQEAAMEVNNFYAAHPDARPHDALLGRMLRDNPSVDLNTAYFELKNAFIEKGFDWSRSIDENLANASPTPPQSSTHVAPMPNGRTPTSGMVSANEVKIAHEDTDTGDIIKQAMREAGMNV